MWLKMLGGYKWTIGISLGHLGLWCIWDLIYLEFGLQTLVCVVSSLGSESKAIHGLIWSWFGFKATTLSHKNRACKNR